MREFQAEPFDERLGRITKRHKKMANGYVTKMGKDGLISAHPPRRIRFPWKFMILFLVLGFVFKAAIFAALGEAKYSERTAILAQGNKSERIGAYLMQVDPLSLWISDKMRPLFYADDIS